MKEQNNKVLNEYVSRLKKEALLKAFLCALGIGFAALLITAFACWFTEFSGYWIFAVVFLVPFGAAMPLFYFYVFYPSEKYVAKRLDKLGLDERILTMVEFENQDSYIMKRQREDAIKKLSGLNTKLVKFALSAALIAVPVVAADAALTMTTVYALAEADVIPSGKDLVNERNRDKTKFELVYKIPDSQKDFGVLYSASNPEGANEITLTVGRGQDGESVMPVAAKGYVFLRWSDGVGDYIRTDTSVQGKIVVTAIFEEIGLDYGNDEEEDGELPDGAGDPDNRPNRQPSDPNDNRDPLEPSDMAGGGVPTDQYVFDGKTDYGGLVYEEAYENAMNELNQSGGADSESKQIAIDYIEAIKRN